MTLDDYTRLADDGCPLCREDWPEPAPWFVAPELSIIERIREAFAKGWKVVKLKMRLGK